jgi:DNA polymerase-3 subunit delta'
VTHEKPGSIGVEDIRSQVNNDMEIKPYYGPKKIYIINESEKMTVQAQNALLKTLEEPPAYGVIILLTTNAEAMLPTILSRCVVLHMRPVEDSKIEEYLMTTLMMPDYRAKVCAAFARGNMGKAKSMAENEDFEHIRDEAVSLMKYIQDMEISEIVTAVKKITDYKMDVSNYLDILIVWYRDILLFKATKDINHLIFQEEIQYIRKIAGRSSYEGIEDILRALDKAQQRLMANVNFDLTMELLFLTIKENS